MRLSVVRNALFDVDYQYEKLLLSDVLLQSYSLPLGKQGHVSTMASTRSISV